MRTPCISFLLLAAVLTLPACKKATQVAEVRPPEVTVIKAQEREVNIWHEYTGRIEAVESVDIRARVSGHLEEIRFVDGDPVKKGDILFVVDRRAFQNQYQSAEAELARSKAAAVLAKSEADRAVELFQKNAISKEDYEKRVAGVEEANSNILAAEAKLANAKLDLDFTEVRSPIDGVAGRHLVSVGNLVTEDNTLLTNVVSIDPVYAYFQISESRLLGYMEHFSLKGIKVENLNIAVEVGLADGKEFPYKGVIDFLDTQVAAGTGTLLARAKIPNESRRLVPGLFARVRFPSGLGGQRVVVPPRAILNNQDRKVVYVVGANNIVEYREVELGPIEDGEQIIFEGLKAGETIVVDGLLYSRPGAPVAPKPLPPAPAPEKPTQAAAADKAQSKTEATPAPEATPAATATPEQP